MRYIIVLVTLLLGSSAALAQDSLKVYAASSMTNAVDSLIDEFEAQHDIKMTPVYASTSSLVRQIERGAPADIFISANEKWMTYLVDRGYAKSDAVTFVAMNELVLITPNSYSAASDVTSVETMDIHDKSQWEAKLDSERLAIGNTLSVPAGIYAKESLQNLSVWNSVKTRLAPTNNVRMALALVERGEAALGIVYKTDALLSKEVSVIASFPDSSHSPIRYPVANLSQSPSSDLFVDFLQSPKAKTIMIEYGFKVGQ